MKRLRLLFGTALLLTVLCACQRQEEPAASDAAAPPSEVGIIEAKPEAIPFVSELPGRISATRIAEVRPRVGGIVLERAFEQGTNVKEGAPLFRIDPATFEVAVEAAKAGIARADAVLVQARQTLERTRSLVSKNAISRAQLETAVAADLEAAADLASARAQRRAAEINLNYATIRAPISGRIGRAIVTEGALVNTTDVQAMATIQQLDPVYADIQQPVAQLLRLRAALKDGTLAQIEPDIARVRLKLDDGTDYAHPGRLNVDDLLKLNVRNAHGGMVPLSAFASAEWTVGPTQIVGYNGYPAVRISGEAKPGFSSGEAIAEMERLAGELPDGFAFEWTGQSLQEIQSGSQAPFLIGLSVLFVFLCLAGLYGSWSIPASVMLVVPLGVIGSVAAVTLTGLSNDVYFTVGIITIVGLSAKNAILIVEVAKDLMADGKGLREAAIEASRLRFRPILMTSLAFTMGVLPMAIASGASAASQNAIGVNVVGGMISATVLAVLFVPVFFVFVMRLVGAEKTPAGAAGADAAPVRGSDPDQPLHVA